MKETPKRRIAVTSSLNKIFIDQLGNREVVRGEALIRPPAAAPFYIRLLNRYLKTT
jgi:hypothetical protein